MTRKALAVAIVILVTIIFASHITVAETQIPIGLQKIIDYNKQSTADFSLKISLFIAFFAGILGILSPCLLPILPAYFSYTFKEKKNITLMTLVFFFGFATAFVSMGVIAGFIGAQVLSVVQSGWVVTLAGIAITGLGIMSLLGKGFSSFFRGARSFKNDIPGTFMFGLFFALGWTACLGPVLAGILGIGAVLHNPFSAGMLLFFYALGNLVPLFILSLFYDKFNIANSKFFKSKLIAVSLGKKKYFVHRINLISGGLFILIGMVMIIFQGTGLVNTWDLFGTRQYFYTFQNSLLAWDYAKPVSIILFATFVITIGFHTYHKWRLSRKKS